MDELLTKQQDQNSGKADENTDDDTRDHGMITQQIAWIEEAVNAIRHGLNYNSIHGSYDSMNVRLSRAG